MTLWTERSPVAAALLNPALLGVVTAAAASEYRRASDKEMPWALAFLIAPLVLHRETREALPRDTRSHLATWVTNNPVLRSGFPQRARSLVEPVREGLRFGLANGFLSVTQGGGLLGALSSSARPQRGSDLAAVVRSAGFVGKWLTKIDQPSTAFALLGVAP
ncbi:three component ABC system middle component [Microbispora maris]|uniref:three component ABC system middle component n=1 Tax=Microbispora maris TaxID=3144104 RepID=UPI003D1547A8